MSLKPITANPLPMCSTPGMKWRPAPDVRLPGLDMCRRVHADRACRYVMYDTREECGVMHRLVHASSLTHKALHAGWHIGLIPGLVCEYRQYHFIFAR